MYNIVLAVCVVIISIVWFLKRRKRVIEKPQTVEEELKEETFGKKPKQGKHIFVCVGTTFFDDLIRTVSSPIFVDIVKRNGYSSMTVQYGKGSIPSKEKIQSICDGFCITFFNYKKGLHNEMKKADLIISHSGSGSLFEALALKKKVIAVVNDTLMDNHQLEIAEELHKRQHIVKTRAKLDLLELLHDPSFFTEILPSLSEFPEPQTSKFGIAVNHEMGIK